MSSIPLLTIELAYSRVQHPDEGTRALSDKWALAVTTDSP
jgi:hypothetical protein